MFLPLVCVFVLVWLQFVYISFALYNRFFERNVQLLTSTSNIASDFCYFAVIDSSSPQVFQVLNTFHGVSSPLLSPSVSPPASCTNAALLRALRLSSLRISFCASPHAAQLFD